MVLLSVQLFTIQSADQLQVYRYLPQIYIKSRYNRWSGWIQFNLTDISLSHGVFVQNGFSFCFLNKVCMIEHFFLTIKYCLTNHQFQSDLLSSNLLQLEFWMDSLQFETRKIKLKMLTRWPKSFLVSSHQQPRPVGQQKLFKLAVSKFLFC